MILWGTQDIDPGGTRGLKILKRTPKSEYHGSVLWM